MLRSALFGALLALIAGWNNPAVAQSNDTAKTPDNQALDLLLDLARDPQKRPTDPGRKPNDEQVPQDADCPPSNGSVSGHDDCVEPPGTGSNDPEAPPRNPGGLPPLLLPGVLVDLIEDLIPTGPGTPSAGDGLPRQPTAETDKPAASAATPRRAARISRARRQKAALRLPRPPAAGSGLSGSYVPDEVLIVVEGTEDDARAIAATNGLDVRSLRISGLLGAVYARLGIPDGRPVAFVLGQLTGDDRVIERVPNHLYSLQQSTGLPRYDLAKLTLDPAASGDFGSGTRVAVIDTAVADDSPSLRGAVAAYFDALPGQPVSSREHGTTIAALIAGRGDFPGSAPGAELLIARAFDKSSGGETLSNADAILASLDWAWEKEANVINMSFTGPRNRLIELGCNIADENGIHLVAAAGNNGPNAPFAYPAAFPSVMAVTAIDSDDRIMEMANQGRYVLFSAPGVDLVAPVPGGVDIVTGTSFAAALVSGVVAAVHGAHSGLSPRLLKQRLTTSARDLGKPGRDDTYGLGLIDASGAIK